jgi:glutamate synthase domain-containing protein 2
MQTSAVAAVNAAGIEGRNVGALMADGHVDGDNLICGVHQWDYRIETGVSEYDNDEALEKFTAWIDVEDDAVYVDEYEVRAWEKAHPQAYKRDDYLGLYADHHGTDAEPFNAYIKELAQHGLEGLGHHGNVSAMGIALTELPRTDDIQLLTGQFARKPLLDDAPVETEVIIGRQAARPLRLEIPIFVSDMSFGALSEEAKVALAQGAELAGTGICSGEVGCLGMRACHTNNCPVGIATQKDHLRARLLVDKSAKQLCNYFF